MSVLAANDEILLQHALDDLELLGDVVAKTTSLLAECEHLSEEQLSETLASRGKAELAYWRLQNFVKALQD